MKENGEENKEVLVKNTIEENHKKKADIADIYMLFGMTYIGRLIMTIYSFHGLFFIYNIIIQYIILIPGLLYEIKEPAGRLILSFIYIIFAISSANILVIPTHEFLSFPFLVYKNPLCHIQSFYYIFREIPCDTRKLTKEKTIFSFIFNLFLFFMQIFYILGLLLGYASLDIKFKDYTKFVILIIIYFYYLTIFLCYFALSLYFTIKIILTHNKEETQFSKIILNRINTYFEDKPSIPDINLMSYLINPLLRKNYDYSSIVQNDEKEKWYLEDWIFTIGILIKVVMVIFSLIAFCFIFNNIGSIDGFSCFNFILLFLVMSILSISFNFPFGYRNIKTHGICQRKRKFVFRCNYCNPKVKYKRSIRHPIIISVSRLICDFIIIVVAIALVGINYLHQDNDNIEDKLDDILPSSEIIETKNKLLLPNICYSSIHNFPLQLFLPFINDAYYYNQNHDNTTYGPFYDSSLQIKNYTKLFFTNDYQIKVIGNLINQKNTVKMVQYNVINSKEELTILSIKGTSYNRDIYLDAQLYFSSILLNILTTFSILTPKESITFKLMEYSLSIPYRIFFRYLIIDEYLKLLQDAYIENEYSFYKNVVIVGHSLGGGLAKLLGRIMKKEAISLSGPGVNAFHSLWQYEGKSENFEISVVDLVPDMDLVPRVETSGGTVYRIICKAGVFKCHEKVMSLCEVLIMCRNPNYEVYCKNIALLSSEEIQDLYTGSELNE